jgi:hypothetical protein
MTIVHHAYACPACEASGAQLYHFGRDNGATVEVAHGCEHYIRDSYPDNPPPAEWLAERAVAPDANCRMPGEPPIPHRLGLI